MPVSYTHLDVYKRQLIIFTIIPVAPLSGGSLEDQLEQIKKEKEETKKKIEDAKKKEQEYLGQVNKVEDQLLSSLDQLNDLNTNLADVKSNIDKMCIRDSLYYFHLFPIINSDYNPDSSAHHSLIRFHYFCILLF